jgi:hypothetical protein
MHRTPVEADHPFIRLQCATEDTDQGAFAGSILPDQTKDFAPVNGEPNTFQSTDARKIPDYSTDLKQRFPRSHA